MTATSFQVVVLLSCVKWEESAVCTLTFLLPSLLIVPLVVLLANLQTSPLGQPTGLPTGQPSLQPSSAPTHSPFRYSIKQNSGYYVGMASDSVLPIIIIIPFFLAAFLSPFYSAVSLLIL
jgi:hypothetical protein